MVRVCTSILRDEVSGLGIVHISIGRVRGGLDAQRRAIPAQLARLEDPGVWVPDWHAHAAHRDAGHERIARDSVAIPVAEPLHEGEGSYTNLVVDRCVRHRDVVAGDLGLAESGPGRAKLTMFAPTPGD